MKYRGRPPPASLLTLSSFSVSVLYSRQHCRASNTGNETSRPSRKRDVGFFCCERQVRMQYEAPHISGNLPPKRSASYGSLGGPFSFSEREKVERNLRKATALGTVCIVGFSGRIAESMLELLPIPKRSRNRRGDNPLGGKQRLSMARAMPTQPKIVPVQKPDALIDLDRKRGLKLQARPDESSGRTEHRLRRHASCHSPFSTESVRGHRPDRSAQQ